MRRRPTALALALTVLGALVSAAPAAAAITITSSGTTITVTGDDGANTIEYQSSGDPNQVRFVSSTDTITAGGGCIVEGPPYPDTVNCGTPNPNWVIQAALGGGDDRWTLSNSRTDFPRQIVDAGAGNDTIRSGELDDQLTGGDGSDTLIGIGGNDAIDGGPGNDRLTGSSGDDTITGGPGVDSLFGDGEFSGFNYGNDTLRARDGEIDALSCSFGADTAIADANDTFDVLGDCESRDVGGASPGPAPGGGAPGGGGGGALTVALGAPKPLKLGAALRGRALSFRVTFSAACTATVGLVVVRRDARRLKLGTKDTVIGRAVDQVPEPGTFAATLKLNRSARAKLRRARSVPAQLVLVCRSAAGAEASAQRRVVLRR
jgi:hypothetical protein